MEDAQKSKLNKIVLWIFFGLFFIAIASNFYHFFYTKNYDYLVEASCDPTVENCFFRDCEESPDDCPPNGLSYYKEYYVKAYDFKKCTDNSCAEQCMSGEIQCKPIECDSNSGDTCKGVGSDNL